MVQAPQGSNISQGRPSIASHATNGGVSAASDKRDVEELLR